MTSNVTLSIGCVANTCIRTIASFPLATTRQSIQPVTLSLDPLSSAQMYSRAGTSESGVLYVVKDKLRGTARYVKRPKAPPTSPPLASDFDQCTTRPPTERGPTRSSWAPTSAPLPEDFDAVTYTAVTHPAIDDVPVDLDHRLELDLESTRRTKSFDSRPSRGTTGARQRSRTTTECSVDVGTYGEFGEYTKEMQQVFPSANGFNVSVSKSSPKHPKRMGESIAPPLRRKQQQNWNSSKTRRKGKTEFDVVKDRILEETPEKTTTISTWRQRVADEVDDKEEDMSVYYLTPRDYEVQVQEFSETMSSKKLGKQRSHAMSSMETISFGSKSTFRQGSSHTSMTELDQRRSSSPVAKSNQRDHWAPTASVTALQKCPPRARRSFTLPLPAKTADLWRPYTPIRTSTPNKSTDLTLPPELDVPFIPTRSGSTISTIKSQATMQFQDILSSCTPSLIHIASTLVELGIHSEEHLRAIRTMTDDVRDREVRDEAIRKGITVMEWALLLDKIRSL